MPKRLLPIIGALILLIAIIYPITPTLNPAAPTIYAQTADACTPLVQEALQKVANTCIDLGRNEICYGYDQVSAVLRDSTLTFESAGDIVSVEQVENIITRPIDPDTGEWGIAMMRLQADLPDDSDGFVTLLLFGGTEITNQVELASNTFTCEATNATTDNLNIRSGPGTNFPAVDIFDAGTSLAINGRNEAGDWLRTPLGWVSAELVTTECDVNQLALVSESDPQLNAPMQSFTLQMDETAACETAPTGLMVQTESGQTASLMVNNVQISIGSTALLKMSDDNAHLTIGNIGGNVIVTSNGIELEIPTGSQSEIEFDEAGDPSDPGDLEVFEDEVIFEELIEEGVFEEIVETEEWFEEELITEEGEGEVIEEATPEGETIEEVPDESPDETVEEDVPPDDGGGEE